MKRLLALSLLVIAFAPFTATSAQAACRAPNCWGALAVNTQTGRWAWTVNHPTRGIARRTALRRCRFRCNRTLVFRNSCAAYALARNGGWGWAANYPSRAVAQRRAMFECVRRNRGRGCRIRVWACTSRI